MVDIQTRTPPVSDAPSRDVPRIRVALHANRAAALAAIDALPADIVSSAFQHPDFLRAWVRHSPHEPAFMTFVADGAGPVLLPLERARANLLVYVGERHANANFPAGRPADLAALAAAGEKAIVSALRAARPGGHVILLERQLEEYRGVTNPFVFGHSGISPNPALSLSLKGGMDGVLDRHSGKRRRKRFRQQERDLEKIGGYRFVPRVRPEDVPAILTQLFDLKSQHFRAAGIHDVFADAYVRDFLIELFVEDARQGANRRVIKTLEADGKTIAGFAATVHDGRMIAEFGSYDPEYAHYSPGDLLFFRSIREAADSGLEIFDFSVGDEPYKRGWCEIETRHRDTVIPLDTVGRLLGAAKAARRGAVRSIKENPTVWKTFKQLRRRLPLMR